MTRLPAMLIVATLLLAAVSPTSSQDSDRGTDSMTLGKTLIEPGYGIGPLKIGDSQERALELFPKKYEDQQWDDACGTTFVWTDTDNKIRGGSLLIRVKKGKVFQIESATTRFSTAEGIAVLDPPDKIAHAYKDLRAYTLLTQPSEATGDRPLVFWVDHKKGIAFSFAYYPSEHQRYLYKITVFAPNKTFCPEQETTSSPKWQSIPSYALEPPRELSPETQ